MPSARASLDGWPFDAAFTALAAWLVAGVTWDFAVHIEGVSFEEEGFVTAPHVTFYAAFLAIVALFAVAAISNRRRGASWASSLPTGYGYGVLGLVLFAAGGPMDYFWHGLFGAEQGIEALASPTHLLLASGAVLFMSSPLRSAWIRELKPFVVRQLPAVISAGFVVVSVASFALYGNPLFHPVATGDLAPGHGVLAVAWFSALVTGVCLTLVRRFELAPGAFTVLFAVIALPFQWHSGTFLPAMIGTGLVADAFATRFRPSPDRAVPFRAFAALVPLVLFSGYFLTHDLVWGTGWSTHIWAGAIVVAVLVGVLTSYLAVPYGGDRRTKTETR